MKALVLIAHGSRQENANLEIESCVRQLENRLGRKYQMILHAFLEFASPSLKDALEEAVDCGADSVDVYPFFLNDGAHVSADIPRQIELLHREYPECHVRQLQHFGSTSEIINLIARHIEKQA